MLTGPRILVALLVALYAAFLAWYGGRGAAMTDAERDALLARIEQNAQSQPRGDGHLLASLRELVANDDGREFYMLNLIRYHEQAQYPPGSEFSGTGRDADRRYMKAIFWPLLSHASIPVFIGEPQGRFLHEAGDIEWQRVAIVRYRSRRALLEMVEQIAGNPVGVHKWASIERTEVFPVRAEFTLIFARGFVAALLAALGALVHLILRRWPRYSGVRR